MIIIVLIILFFIVKSIDDNMTNVRSEKCKYKNPGDVVIVLGKARTCT